MSPRAKHELAREHLNRGLAGVASEDATEAVAWLFLALEAAIVAIAEAHDVEVTPHHWKKADVARRLHRDGVIGRDFTGLLELLNEARKVATYDGDDPDLGEASLEDLAADVEAAVVIAERETKR